GGKHRRARRRAAHRTVIAVAAGEGSQTPASDIAQGSGTAPREEIEYAPSYSVLVVVGRCNIELMFPIGEKMKYVISWFERPQGSPIEYENAQKRILEVFGQWKAPANFKIEFFVIRVGEWGGHMLMECDDPVIIHKFCSMLPAFIFQVHPVIPVEDAVWGELEVIAWRDRLKRK